MVPAQSERVPAVRRLCPAGRDRHADRRRDPPHHRPGHFHRHGPTVRHGLAPGRRPEVAQALAKAHVTGPHRTLMQDPVFAIDQLVEIAIRALSRPSTTPSRRSPASTGSPPGSAGSRGACSTRASTATTPAVCDLSSPIPSYARMANRAFDKIRQAAAGMPAVLIRLMDSIGSIMLDTTTPEQRTALRRQADMVLRLSERSVAEPHDLEEIRSRYHRIPGEEGFAAESSG